jgi:hypothetical protein
VPAQATDGRGVDRPLLPKAGEGLVEVELDQSVLPVPAVSALGEPEPLARDGRALDVQVGQLLAEGRVQVAERHLRRHATPLAADR